MQTVVGVRFKQAGKIYYFDPGEVQLQVEDHVIVETAHAVWSLGLLLSGHGSVGRADYSTA